MEEVPSIVLSPSSYCSITYDSASILRRTTKTMRSMVLEMYRRMILNRLFIFCFLFLQTVTKSAGS